MLRIYVPAWGGVRRQRAAILRASAPTPTLPRMAGEGADICPHTNPLRMAGGAGVCAPTPALPRVAGEGADICPHTNPPPHGGGGSRHLPPHHPSPHGGGQASAPHPSSPPHSGGGSRAAPAIVSPRRRMLQSSPRRGNGIARRAPRSPPPHAGEVARAARGWGRGFRRRGRPHATFLRVNPSHLATRPASAALQHDDSVKAA